MRSHSICRYSVTIALTLLALAVGCSQQATENQSSVSTAAQPEPSTSEQTVTASHTEVAEASDSASKTPADPQNVPNGTPAELISYIERLAEPEPFETEEEMRRYMEPAAKAIITAADRILEDRQAVDQQIVDAVEWKVEAFRVKAELGEQDAMRQANEFLVKLRSDSRPAIAASATTIWLRNQLRLLQRQTSQERTETLRELTEYLNTAELKRLHANLAIEIGDLLAETPDAPHAARMIKQLLPRFQLSTDEGVLARLSLLEGLVRRLELPGNKLELEGTLLDGTPLDWESYRGKVVLIDFWATACIPCRAEIPNILANYEAYHDKGFDVLGISLDDDKSEVETFVNHVDVPWPTLFNFEDNEEGWDHPMAVRYAIIGIPQTILVDQKGNVVSMNVRGSRLRRELQRLLGDPAPANSESADNEDSAAIPQGTDTR